MVLRRERSGQCEAGRGRGSSCGKALEAEASPSTRAPRIPSLVGVGVNTTTCVAGKRALWTWVTPQVLEFGSEFWASWKQRWWICAFWFCWMS